MLVLDDAAILANVYEISQKGNPQHQHLTTLNTLKPTVPQLLCLRAGPWLPKTTRKPMSNGVLTFTPQGLSFSLPAVGEECWTTAGAERQGCISPTLGSICNKRSSVSVLDEHYLCATRLHDHILTSVSKHTMGISQTYGSQVIKDL